MEPITTTIEWLKPEHEAPPFNTRILVMLGGAAGQIGSPLTAYNVIKTVIVRKSSPNDDYEDEGETEYEALQNGSYQFHELQFTVIECDSDDDGDESDWYSDSIIVWAHYPAAIAAEA